MNHYQYIKGQCGDGTASAKLVLLPCAEDVLAVRKQIPAHSNIVILNISECVTDSRFIPAPDALFTCLDEKIRERNSMGKIPWVFGLDAMLILWNQDNVLLAYSAIKDMMDDTTKHFHLFSSFHTEHIASVFANSRYHDRVLSFSRQTSQGLTFQSTEICLLDIAFKHWILEGQIFQNFKDFLINFENGLLEETKSFIYTNAPQYPIAAIDARHLQIHTAYDFLHAFCSLNDRLSADALSWMLGTLNGNTKPILQFLQGHFFPLGCSQQSMCRQVLEIFQKLPAVQKEVYLWTLKKSVSANCYLKCVLDDEHLSVQNFLTWYVEKALDLWDSAYAATYAEERAEAMQPLLLHLTGALEQFIEQLKAITDIGCCRWLNNGTSSEKREIIRRLMSEPPAVVPLYIHDIYPQLGAYLDSYHLGNNDLDAYFNEYRHQKLTNALDVEFCERASQVAYPPSGIPSRTMMLQKYSSNEDTVLLVVDALGVEYIPAILKLALSCGLGIQSASVCYAQLPTSTKFNPIEWPAERRWNDIKKLDEIIHNGAESHTGKSIEDNLVAQLDVLENVLVPEVSKALAKYKTVVLTSDHGASRLAVLAYNQNLSKNLALSDPGDVEDWRYTATVPGQSVPCGTTDNIAGDYWIVKGYNRFSKKGGKSYELHGGLTWEEMLVPLVVFQQGAVFEAPSYSAPKAEFETDSDFDEL